MSTTYNPEPEIQRYLKRLSKAARCLPRAQRRDLVAEIEQHIRESLIETRVDNAAEMLTVLDHLGDPEEIVAAASGSRAVTRSTAMETWAIILLLLGGFLWGIGWIAGVVLLWSSSVWTLRDKLIGTLVVPGGLATAAALLFFGLAGQGETCVRTGPAYSHWSCTGRLSALEVILMLFALAVSAAGSIATAIYLGRRLSRQKGIYAGDSSAVVG